MTRAALRTLLGLVLACGVARAQTSVPVLVMPTQLGGVVPDRAGWQREFDARMDRAVRKTGRTSRAPGPLTASEASCRTAECMARLAEAAGTDIVLGARVVADRGSPPSYKLVVDRYDRDRPGMVRTENAECSVCTEVEAAERLEQVATSLLPSLVVVPRRTVVVTPEPPVAPLAPAQPVVATANPNRERNLELALALTSAVAAGGVAMISVGARASSLDGHRVGSPMEAGGQTPLVYDTKTEGLALITTGAVVLGGSLVALALEARALVRSRR